jgi:hypothetical protein
MAIQTFNLAEQRDFWRSHLGLSFRLEFTQCWMNPKFKSNADIRCIIHFRLDCSQ